MSGQTVASLFDWSVRNYSDRIAIHFYDEEWSYARVGEESACVANALDAWGIGLSDRVSILSLNTPEYLTTYFGVLGAGAAVNPVGVRLPSGDHAFVVKDAGARALFFHAELLDLVEAMRDDLPVVEKFVVFRSTDHRLPEWVTPYEQLLSTFSSTKPDVAIAPGDMSLVMYTGGTTGRPRGVVQTHASWSAYIAVHLMEFDYHDDDVTAATGPLSHATMVFVLPTFLKGGRVTILKEFDPYYLLGLIEEQSVTKMPLVPTMIYTLLDMPETKQSDLSSLRTIFYGASPMSPDRLEEAIEVFGQVFVQLFGQTESPAISRLCAEDHRVHSPDARRRLASCGTPFIGVDVRIVDEANHEVAQGDLGEICTRSPYTMREYWRRPAETLDVLRDGWVHTGDMGRMDAGGYLYIVDRKKDMIITGAFNVYSKEVEDVLTEHPAVAQAAVIGVPDPKWGEAVKACIILRAGATATKEDLMAFVRDRRGPVQAPKSVDFLEAFPLTQALKPDKKKLRAPYWEREGRQVH